MDKITHTTFVIRHDDEEAARQCCSLILEKYPMFAESGSATTSVGLGDKMSSLDAVEMALDCPDLSDDERVTFARELLETNSWGECQVIFSAWELVEKDGQLLASERKP